MDLKALTNPILYAVIAYALMITDYLFTHYLFFISPIPLTETNPLGIGLFSLFMASRFPVSLIAMSYLLNKLEVPKYVNLFMWVFKTWIATMAINQMFRSVGAITNNYEVYQIILQLFPHTKLRLVLQVLFL